MTYAEGADWTIEVRRHPLSGGYQVYVQDRNPRTGNARGRVVGNQMGYARRDTAELRVRRAAQRFYEAEGE